MLLTKFDLYKSEWLDLVFTNRNKSYGAYELRQSYSKTMTKAMGIAFALVAVGIMTFSVALKSGTEAVIKDDFDGGTIVTLTDIKPPVKIEPPVETTTPPAKPAGPKLEAKTAAIPTSITSNEDKAVEPVKTDDLSNAVISTTTNLEGKPTDGNAIEGAGNEAGGKGEGSGTNTEDTGVHNPFEAMEKMPAPVGGQQAWTKFLQRNLRYPSEADGVSGKVFISFIIEKDGRLSDITVLRGGEHGFGDEALRVFKKAAAWTPGIQNGRPVRVKYVIPINFQQPE